MFKTKLNNQRFFLQAGQTMIETMAAVFILVMGITSAVGLAVYTLTASTNITNQIVGTALAREGIEAVKNMRDTNWLKAGILDSDCFEYLTSLNTSKCHKDWLNPAGNTGFDIRDPGSSQGTRLIFDPSNSKFWQIHNDASNKWGLDFTDNISSNSFMGFYSMPNISSGLTHGNSGFYRKLILTQDASGNFNKTEYNRVKVVSQVWWVDRKCPRVDNYAAAKSICKIELQAFLTNWKNY